MVCDYDYKYYYCSCSSKKQTSKNAGILRNDDITVFTSYA